MIFYILAFGALCALYIQSWPLVAFNLSVGLGIAVLNVRADRRATND